MPKNKNTQEEQPIQDLSFFQEFCKEYKVTDENNTIQARIDDGDEPYSFTGKIFSEDKDGNIRMLVFSLNKQVPVVFKTDGTTGKSYGNKYEPFYVTRYKEPKQYTDKSGKIKIKKYDIPKGAGTFPFIPPFLLNLWETKTEIQTLVLTEGYKKAWYASMFNCPVVGLSSITHYKDKETKQLYEDIQTIIKDCKVKNVIVLHDGDCRDISTNGIKECEDLYKRPSGFISAALAVRELLKDLKVDVYFSHVISEAYESHPKGLDDILLVDPGNEINMIQDLLALSRPGTYFHKINISQAQSPLYTHFHLSPVETFYHFHQEKIADSEFDYRGTKYQWNQKQKELEVKIPASAKDYFRVGDQYYKFIDIPNKYGTTERLFQKRQKSTIEDDHKKHHKNFIDFIPKYESFCNVPQNQNYSQIINNCFNIYYPMEWQPEKGECPVSLEYVKHIFGDEQITHNGKTFSSYELGLDYLQLLYTKPTETLPILSLVSRENGTGKSTFGFWLKSIFKQNATSIGNDELEGQFNGLYASRLIIMVEEALVEKIKVMEKIKNQSTNPKIQLRNMGKDHVELDFFGKYIFTSNNETRFIYARKEDTRFWVRKIKPFAKEIPDFLKLLIEEIPAFLYFIENRDLVTSKEGRMWFHPSLIITEAFQKVVDANKHRFEKILNEKMKELFIDSGLDKILMPFNYIKENIIGLRGTEKDSELKLILEENLKLVKFTNEKGEQNPTIAKIPFYDPSGEIVFENRKCRPYIFERKKFVSKDDLQNYQFKLKTETTSQLEVIPNRLPEIEIPFGNDYKEPF